MIIGYLQSQKIGYNAQCAARSACFRREATLSILSREIVLECIMGVQSYPDEDWLECGMEPVVRYTISLIILWFRTHHVDSF